jgi:hypothetical protein
MTPRNEERDLSHAEQPRSPTHGNYIKPIEMATTVKKKLKRGTRALRAPDCQHILRRDREGTPTPHQAPCVQTQELQPVGNVDVECASADESTCTSGDNSSCTDVEESTCNSVDDTDDYAESRSSTATRFPFLPATPTDTSRPLPFEAHLDSAVAPIPHRASVMNHGSLQPSSTPEAVVPLEQYNLLLREVKRQKQDLVSLSAQISAESRPVGKPDPPSVLHTTSPTTPIWIAPTLQQLDSLHPQSSSPQTVAIPFFPQTKKLQDHIDKLFETECGRFYDKRLSMHFLFRLVHTFSQNKAIPCSTIQQFLYTSVVYQTYQMHFPVSFLDPEPSLRASMGVYLQSIIQAFILAIPNPYDIMTTAFQAFIEPFDVSAEPLDVYITKLCTKLQTLALIYDYVGPLDMFPRSRAATFVGNDILMRALPKDLQNVLHSYTVEQWHTFEGVSSYLICLKEQPIVQLKARTQTVAHPTPSTSDPNTTPLCRRFMQGTCYRSRCYFKHDQSQQRDQSALRVRRDAENERDTYAHSNDYHRPSKRYNYRRDEYHRDDYHRDNYRRDDYHRDDYRRNDHPREESHHGHGDYRRDDRKRDGDKHTHYGYHHGGYAKANRESTYQKREHLVHPNRRDKVGTQTSTSAPLAVAATTTVDTKP